MPVEPAITMSAQPTVEPGTAGEGIDRGAAIDLVATSYLFTTGPLALPVATLTPAVSDEEAQKVKDEFAVPAVSGPVPGELRHGNRLAHGGYHHRQGCRSHPRVRPASRS